ncbi:MAG: flavin reductase family protein [Chloroflexota bacterium]|nr:flavin reductase family protein [Chloroflexota bacterium]
MPEEAASPPLQQISYGLYVIGSKNEGEVNGMTANWLTQVSFAPRMLAVAIEAESHTMRNITASKVFSVNVIAEADTNLIEKFVEPQERAGNKLGGVEFRLEQTGCPILERALCWIECEVVQTVMTGDHELVIGRVVNGGENREGDPLTLRAMGWSYGE